MSTAPAKKPAGLTQAQVAKPKPAPAPPAAKPDEKEVSQQTADPAAAKPENDSAAGSKPEPSEPEAVSTPATLTDEQLLAEVKRRNLAPKARPKGARIEVPLDLDEDELEWTTRRFGNHLFQIASAPKGGYFAKPESFVGDVQKVDSFAELEEFDRWPNSKAKR